MTARCACQRWGGLVPPFQFPDSFAHKQRQCDARVPPAFAQLFDPIVETDGFLRAGMMLRAMRWLSKIVDAISHAHQHGMSHGQLRPEHLLLRNDDPTLLGFDPSVWRQLKRGPSHGDKLALRPRDREGRDAPELAGQSHASFSELAAADIWALGVLFVSMLLGEPPDTKFAPGQTTILLTRDLYHARSNHCPLSRKSRRLAFVRRACEDSGVSPEFRATRTVTRLVQRLESSANTPSRPLAPPGACECDSPRRFHAHHRSHKPARHCVGGGSCSSDPHATAVGATTAQIGARI